MKYLAWLASLLRNLMVPLLVVVVWLVVVGTGHVSKVILPAPTEVLKALASLVTGDGIMAAIGWTLLRTVLGFLLGVVVGVLLGTAMGSWRAVHNMTQFSVDFLRSIPATAIFPLFMMFLGLGLKSMVALIAFPCCWLVTINTMYGVKNSSQVRREMAQVFRLSKGKRFFRVTLLDAMPSIAASLRLSVAICLHMAIIAEMFMGSQLGIGRRIYDAHMVLNVSEMYAVIILAGVLGYVLNQAFVILEKRITFWGGRA